MKIKIREYRKLKPFIITFLKREGSSAEKLSEVAAVGGCPVVAVYTFAYEERMISKKEYDRKIEVLKKFYKYDEISE